MKVDKIARLFAAQSGPALYAPPQTSELFQNANSDSEAVTGLGGSGARTTEAAERDAKVARLKDAVKSGSYNPDPREVAASVYRELVL